MKMLKIPRDQRFCLLCKNAVEEELHFLFCCPVLNESFQIFDEQECEGSRFDLVRLFFRCIGSRGPLVHTHLASLLHQCVSTTTEECLNLLARDI